MAAKAYNSEDEFEPRRRRSRRSRASAPTAALNSEDTGSDDDDTPIQVRGHSRVRRSFSTVSSASSSSQITVRPTPPEPAAQERKLLATRFARCIHVSMYTFVIKVIIPSTLAAPCTVLSGVNVCHWLGWSMSSNMQAWDPNFAAR